MADNNRGVPLVSHRLFNDTFAFIPLAGAPAVFGREEAQEIHDALGRLLGDSPPSPKDGSTPVDPPKGFQAC